MDFTQILTNVFTISPLAGCLLYFLRTVWMDQRKDRAESTAMMKEHNASMLQIQKESIMAQNNGAEAVRQVAVALGDIKEHLSDKIDDLKPTQPRNGKIRQLVSTPVQPTPASA